MKAISAILEMISEGEYGLLAVFIAVAVVVGIVKAVASKQ
ncbi:hypothetical protein DB31_1045 [Hyalangium minutum]|uniref:Uncharacterized protein n=1 Tax=Hyalangium minutum TaxID=394096 RepID=A0A085WFV9_9BACT|nr:hypothetical protein DB31_1045 [Hyalangium minutum]